jgi:pimeloyl-ACP methyl ester carboxylesterase
LYIVYRDKKVYYTRLKGDGKPLVLLHGWGGDSRSLGMFARGKNAISIDFPPFGKSAEPCYEYTLFDYVNIVLKIFEKEKIEKVDCIAHSFGGRVALQIASMGLVDKLVIMGGAGLKSKFSIKKYIAKLKYKAARRRVVKGILDKSALDKYGSADFRELSPIMKKTFVNIVNYHQNNILKDIKCATLLLWGSKDTQTPISYAKTMTKNMVDCKLIEFEDCGHFAYLQRPFEFLTITNKFLKD